MSIKEPTPNQSGISISRRVYMLEDHDLASPATTKIEDITQSQLHLLGKFYNLAIKQSEDSFRMAFWAAVFGLLFYIAAIVFFINTRESDLALISLVIGTLIEIISAINFYLYNKTTTQLAVAQERLYSTQNFLLANSICNSLDGEHKQHSRIAVIQALVSGSNEIQKP